MNSRDLAHQEDRKALRSMERRPWVLIIIAVIAVVSVSGVVYGIVNAHQTTQVRDYAQQVRELTAQAQAAADKAGAQSLAGCQAYQLLANAPLTSSSSAFAIQISVAMREAYSTAHCTLGTLNPPDPRVAKLLPPGVN